LVWQPWWQRVDTPHYVPTGVTLSLLVVGMTVPQKDQFTGDIHFDDALRDGFALGSRDLRREVVVAGDFYYWTLTFYPRVADDGMVALAVHQDTDVAWEMFGIDGQAYAFTSMATRLTVRPISLAAASFVGWSAIAGDRHYGSGTFGGAGLGMLSGGRIPDLLHYEFLGAPSAKMALAPKVNDTTAGVTLLGLW
jgi:hypothetical protein